MTGGSRPALAYFFFDGRDVQKGKQLYDGLIKSLLWQFCRQCHPIPPALVDLSYHGHPSRKPLEDTLYSTVSRFHQTFIIIDALDECTPAERGKVLEWITMLSSRRVGTLHIALTSRVERDISDVLRGLGAFCVDLVAEPSNHDIETYVNEKVDTFRKFGKQRDEGIRTEIKSTLRDGAQGMWVSPPTFFRNLCSNNLGFDGPHYSCQSWKNARIDLPCESS